MEVVNVLVLYPSTLNKFMIQNLPLEVSSQYKFIYHDKSKLTSLQECFEDAKKIVMQENIKIIFTTGDIAAMMKAALVKEFPHLRGPSVESVFLAYHKYYTRCFLDPSPVPFASIDLTAAHLDQCCEQALHEVGIPAFFKPATSNSSLGISSITDAKQLKEFAQSYMASDDATLDWSNPCFMNLFLSVNIDEEKYPLASKPTAILESHMGSSTKIINTDSYVFDGKIYHWSISDNLFSKSKPCYTFGAFIPTTLPESTQQKIWNLHDTVVKRMIDFGFNNEFVNTETFLLESGEVKLMEINPRFGANLAASEEVHTNGNPISALLKLAQGVNPGSPIPNGRCALHGYIRTCGSGRAKEFYDYSYTDPVVVPEENPDCLINGSVAAGYRIGRTRLSGDSFEEVMDKYWSICRRVLLKPEVSLWN